MNSHQKTLPKKVTSRRYIAATLTKEILSKAEPDDFPTESESELCMRFGVSRVTVRLALADLEHRRLIYRRHGKGTYAYGSLTRAHPNIGILVKSAEDVKSPELVEFHRGALTVMDLRSFFRRAHRSSAAHVATRDDECLRRRDCFSRRVD